MPRWDETPDKIRYSFTQLVSSHVMSASFEQIILSSVIKYALITQSTLLHMCTYVLQSCVFYIYNLSFGKWIIKCQSVRKELIMRTSVCSGASRTFLLSNLRYPLFPCVLSFHINVRKMKNNTFLMWVFQTGETDLVPAKLDFVVSLYLKFNLLKLLACKL